MQQLSIMNIVFIANILVEGVCASPHPYSYYSTIYKTHWELYCTCHISIDAIYRMTKSVEIHKSEI